MKPIIAVVVASLGGGGAERVVVTLVTAMRELQVSLPVEIDLLVCKATGPYLSLVPPGINLVELGGGRMCRSFVPLCRYLSKRRPDGIISHVSHVNVLTLAAMLLTFSSCPVIAVEHNVPLCAAEMTVKDHIVSLGMKLLYRYAKAVIGVSCAVSQTLRDKYRLTPDKVKTLYNPLQIDLVRSQGFTSGGHPWVDEGKYPLIVGAGRLIQGKDFRTLIEAFSLIADVTDARLIIVGEGPERDDLEQLITKRGLQSRISLPGFVNNPYAIMRHAACFALTSRQEGFSMVLLEALVCGCSIVATDCDYGPREILHHGVFGELVPVGDSVRVAEALHRAVTGAAIRPDPRQVSDWVQQFSADKVAHQYLTMALA